LGAWLVWEGVKLLLALALLAAAPRLVSDVNWLGLVVGLVVVLKGYVLALWPAGRR
jgi:ATP synthase protein I